MKKFTRRYLLMICMLLSASACVAQADTMFISTTRAIVQVNDSTYRNYRKKIYLEKTGWGWKQGADSMFFNDGSTYRATKSYPAPIPCSIDTFYESPYGEKIISTIVLNLGKISFGQRFDKLQNLTNIVVINNDKNLPCFEVHLDGDNPELDRPQLKIMLDENKRIRSIFFRHTFNTAYFFGGKIKMPTEIYFPADQPPVFR